MVKVKIKIDKQVINEARVFGKEVHKRKKFNKDKFITGQEETSDFLGFLFEFIVCDYFNKPRPVLYEGKQVDNYDIMLKGKKFDIKHSKICFVNKDQYERHKGKTDGFLFGDTELLDFGTGSLFAYMFGWIDYDDVPSCSEIIRFKNGSEAYKVNKRKLKDIKELIE